MEDAGIIARNDQLVIYGRRRDYSIEFILVDRAHRRNATILSVGRHWSQFDQAVRDGVPLDLQPDVLAWLERSPT